MRCAIIMLAQPLSTSYKAHYGHLWDPTQNLASCIQFVIPTGCVVIYGTEDICQCCKYSQTLDNRLCNK
jgi:hypothetical protein